MLWLDAALVIVTVGSALIIISPLARILGVYGPTKLVPHGYVLGMYGKPTWRFWALSVLFFAVHAAYNFEKGKVLIGGSFAVMAGVYVISTINAARQDRKERAAATPAADETQDESE